VLRKETPLQSRGRRGRDRIVVRFTTTCVISIDHHLIYVYPKLQYINGFLFKLKSREQYFNTIANLQITNHNEVQKGRSRRDRMLVVVDLQLPVQSVPIATKVVRSNTAHGEVYSIQHYVINFVSLSMVFSGYSGFIHK